MAITGKGFYIWQISRCEGGNPAAIAAAAVQAGLTHVLIKIADGASPYNIDSGSGADLVPPLITALRAQGIIPLGWHYVYGYDPDGEAAIAIQRINQLDIEMYIIDAEAQYKEPGRDAVARYFMALMRSALPSFPMALSTYRYPTYHPAFPFQAFLESVDTNMPQVYWVQNHNPGEQLIRCRDEYDAISPVRPMIPTGSAYLAGDWQPTVEDINEFMDTARTLNMTAANFWEWGHTRLYLPHIWDAIAAYDWNSGALGDIVGDYLAALNTHDPAQVLALYNENAVHVTAARTLTGAAAITNWYADLFNSQLPNGVFLLKAVTSSQTGSRRFTWRATSSAGSVSNGVDAFGLVDGKISYHYTDFSVISS